MDTRSAAGRKIFEKTKADLEQRVSGVQKAFNTLETAAELLSSSSLVHPRFTRVQEAPDRRHWFARKGRE